MPANWQQPLALTVVAFAAGWLVLRAWRKRRAATTGGCGSGSEGGCGCSALKKNLRPGPPLPASTTPNELIRLRAIKPPPPV